jgi:transposase
LRELRAWLVTEGVTQVAMEATGVYWRAPWHVLEAEPGFELLLCNAQHVKNLPGRKTDVADAAWLAQLLECGLLRGSFVPTPVMARLRDLTRYAKKLIEDRARETQRIQKVLEDAGIKLDSVVSDVLGKAARRMIEALIAGERDPRGVSRDGPHLEELRLLRRLPPRRVPRRVIEDLHRLAPDGSEGARGPSIRAGQRNGERLLTEPADIGALERMGLQLASHHAAVEDH